MSGFYSFLIDGYTEKSNPSFGFPASLLDHQVLPIGGSSLSAGLKGWLVLTLFGGVISFLWS